MRERKEGKSRNATAGKVGTLMSALAKSLKNGGSDGARTRDLRRDRPEDSIAESISAPTLGVQE